MINGIKVLVTYSDDTTAYAEQFAAHLSSNTVGKSTVVITYGGYSSSYNVTISHKESEWITTVNATMLNEGLKVKRCFNCYKVVETETLPILVDESGIIVDTNEFLICNIPENLIASKSIVTHYNNMGLNVSVTGPEGESVEHLGTGCKLYFGDIKYTVVSKGDIIGHGVISLEDAVLILQASVGKIEFTDVQKIAGDVDGNGKLSATDALFVSQYSVGKITKFPVDW